MMRKTEDNLAFLIYSHSGLILTERMGTSIYLCVYVFVCVCAHVCMAASVSACMCAYSVEFRSASVSVSRFPRDKSPLSLSFSQHRTFGGSVER